MDCPPQRQDGLCPPSQAEVPASRSPVSLRSAKQSPSNTKQEAGLLCLYLLLLQADHGAVAATPPLPLESCDFLCFDAQDFLVLLVLQFQFLHGKEQP